MGLQNLFHFFGVNLLARRVDADTATAEKRQGTIRFHHTPVARNGIADATNGFEGTGGLFRVLVVAERDGRPLCDNSRLSRSRFNRLIVFIEHPATFADLEFRGLNFTILRHHGGAEANTLGRTETVHQNHLRHVPDQAALDLHAPHHAGGDDIDDVGKIIFSGRGIQHLQHRLGESIAHDHQRLRLGPVRHLPEFFSVERRLFQRDHTAATQHSGKRHQHAGAMHQRATRNGSRAWPLQPDGFHQFPQRFRYGPELAQRRQLGFPQVVLGPDHAFRHAGRATGIDEKLIVW